MKTVVRSDTIDYYEQNACAYALETSKADLSEIRSRFLALLPQGAHILDVGCGAGRDLMAFRAAGCEAEGLEPAPKLAELARAHSGCVVHVGKVENMHFQAVFDGIWACASLLHLSPYEFPIGLSAISRALKKSGVLFLSMQRGTFDRVLPDGRFYALYERDRLLSIVGSAGFDPVDVWETGDTLPGRAEIRWINVLARITHL